MLLLLPNVSAALDLLVNIFIFGLPANAFLSMFVTDAGTAACLRFALFASAFSPIVVTESGSTTFSTLPILDIDCFGIIETADETLTFFVFFKFQNA